MNNWDTASILSDRQKLEKLLDNSTIKSVISYYRFKEIVDKSEKDGCYSLAAFSIRRFSYLFHTYGSEVRQYISEMITSYISKMLSEGEYFASAGDNKMLIYMKGTYSEAIERIKVYFDELSHMMALDKCHMKVTFACGVYQIRDNSENINDVINKAGSAMQTAFDIPSCITEVVHYSDKVYESVVRNNIIENDLVNAVKNNELIVEIQPKFDMKTGKCVSAEALVRWMHPVLGRVVPDDFIPYAEKTGFIIDIDMFVLETVCKYMRSWADAGFTPVTVAVNQSRLHISDPNYVDSVFTMMQEYDVWPNLIELETTESIAFNDYASATEILHRLHDYGFVLSMDDFGSGYSSLYMLHELEYDELKLDRKLVASIGKSEKSVILLKHIIAMAHDMNMTVVAEGVETEEQAAALKSIGCDVAQGFLYSHPLSIDRFEASVFGRVMPDEVLV
ncbi:MAG: EAL domain-containing protein [Oscillospiraceae bacterium]|nr:EAL domain-containing protein [Oscillospiraceae bacterium]